MQDSEENQTPIPESAQDTPTQGKESPKPEKRPLSIWRRMFRFLLVMLIIFGPRRFSGDIYFIHSAERTA